MMSDKDAIEVLTEQVIKLKQELAEYKSTFKLMWDANTRGIKLWRDENPNERELVWPDQGRLVKWLLDQLTAERQLLDIPLRMTDSTSGMTLTMTVRDVAVAEQNFRKQSQVVDKFGT
jgi:hypothetical protein